jgi:hypothetical protein
MPTVTSRHIETLRAEVARRTKARRIQTRAEAERFVREVGFCFFWPIKDVDMPNLFHAIAGRVRDVPNAHDDPDIGKSWTWKDEALGQRKWYYGKLLRSRATLVALDYLPYFYALSPNYGDEADYLGEYESGQLTREARDVYEALYRIGPLDTVRLRREAHLSAENAKSRFEKALTELQVSMKILPVGVAEAGAWRYAFVYELVTRHFPRLAEQARPVSRQDARAKITARFIDNVVAATQADIARAFSVLKWTGRELERTLAGLVEKGGIAPCTVKGWDGEYYVSSAAVQ